MPCRWKYNSLQVERRITMTHPQYPFWGHPLCNSTQNIKPVSFLLLGPSNLTETRIHAYNHDRHYARLLFRGSVLYDIEASLTETSNFAVLQFTVPVGRPEFLTQLSNFSLRETKYEDHENCSPQRLP